MTRDEVRALEGTRPVAVPKRVAIIGLGPSCEAFVDHAKRLGGRRKIADEVWGINALGDVLHCDRVFHLDDVLAQEIRAEARPDSNIAAMLEWMRTATVPIFTSVVRPGYPSLVEYPLEAVINDCGIAYLNNTAAAAVAYANMIGVKELSLWGFDYTYRNSHAAERGRACTEFHLGIAKARGVEIGVPDRTTLLDSIEAEPNRLYGYDCVDIATEGEPPNLRITLTPKAILPTADEMERKYNHSIHPNTLVRG
jgi:hypothetical protein